MKSTKRNTEVQIWLSMYAIGSAGRDGGVGLSAFGVDITFGTDAASIKREEKGHQHLLSCSLSPLLSRLSLSFYCLSSYILFLLKKAKKEGSLCLIGSGTSSDLKKDCLGRASLKACCCLLFVSQGMSYKKGSGVAITKSTSLFGRTRGEERKVVQIGEKLE